MAKTEEQIILGKEFISNKLYKQINDILQEAISYLKDCQLVSHQISISFIRLSE